MGKHIKDPFLHARNLAFIRSRAQARYRGEQWDLSLEEFCHFWSTEALWAQRGRNPQAMVLTRFDAEKPWDRRNCCIMNRLDQLQAKIERYWGRDDSKYFKEAIWYERR